MEFLQIDQKKSKKIPKNQNQIIALFLDGGGRF
jgi:hypothetical protein